VLVIGCRVEVTFIRRNEEERGGTRRNEEERGGTRRGGLKKRRTTNRT
jgi:hypothetical protein